MRCSFPRFLLREEVLGGDPSSFAKPPARYSLLVRLGNPLA